MECGHFNQVRELNSKNGNKCPRNRDFSGLNSGFKWRLSVQALLECKLLGNLITVRR